MGHISVVTGHCASPLNCTQTEKSVQTQLWSSIVAQCAPLLSVPIVTAFYSQTTSENMATWRLLQDFTSRSCTSKTSHCLALKNVEGPTGGPSSGGTTILRFPPTCIPLMPSSKPATWKLSYEAVIMDCLYMHSRSSHPCLMQALQAATDAPIEAEAVAGSLDRICFQK